MNTRSLILLILAFTGINILFAFIAQTSLADLIPYNATFAYKDGPEWVPSTIRAFANMDGVHYIDIAKRGYSEFVYAFFPLYPLSISLLGTILGGNYFLAGWIISLITGLLALLFLYQLAFALSKDKRTAFWSLLLLLLFPTSFYFNAVYTESLFFLLLVGSLLALQKKNYLLAAIVGYFAATTRLVGLFLIIPFFFALAQQVKVLDLSAVNVKRLWQQFISFWKKLSPIQYLVLFAPLLGFASYSLFLWITTGDPLRFFNVQPAFGANRSTSIILPPQVVYRYIKIFITATPNFQYFVATVEFIVFCFVEVELLFDLWKLWMNRINNDAL